MGLQQMRQLLEEKISQPQRDKKYFGRTMAIGTTKDAAIPQMGLDGGSFRSRVRVSVARRVITCCGLGAAVICAVVALRSGGEREPAELARYYSPTVLHLAALNMANFCCVAAPCLVAPVHALLVRGNLAELCGAHCKISLMPRV